MEEDDILSFRREIELMLGLRHPNILQMFGASWEPPDVALLVEFASQGTLEDFMSASDCRRSQRTILLYFYLLLNVIFSSLEQWGLDWKTPRQPTQTGYEAQMKETRNSF